ncbi:hypothetical protein [Dialister micraerophilus]|uniref:Uncharacterized protein n=1 Tax=Dialister micraerophilus UPII 345-E TaxID=910314 RepID=E4L9K6_9FIRM|nr:hypothetical protein [Dialister micraerophilus]EFR42512.1 hypothetical protein HMPREF9220_0433 [Dialister micraerophilus UPII 345-E]
MKKLTTIILAMLMTMSITGIRANTPQGGNLRINPNYTNEEKINKPDEKTESKDKKISKENPAKAEEKTKQDKKQDTKQSANKEEKNTKTEVKTEKETKKDEVKAEKEEVKKLEKTEKTENGKTNKDETEKSDNLEKTENVKEEKKENAEEKKNDKEDKKELEEEKNLELSAVFETQMPKFFTGELPIKGFLNELDYPKNIKFTPMISKNLPEIEEIPQDILNMTGAIYVKKDHVLAKAGVFGIEFPKILFIPEAEGLFLENGIDKRLVKPILGFNTKFVNAGTIINEFLKNLIAKVRNDNFPIPYDFVNADIDEVMQFQRDEKNPDLYSAGVRGKMLIDGFVLPVTMKVDFMRKGDVYRIIFIAYDDSQKEIIEPAEKKILELATQ